MRQVEGMSRLLWVLRFTALTFRKAKYIFKVSQDALGELKMKCKQ